MHSHTVDYVVYKKNWEIECKCNWVAKLLSVSTSNHDYTVDQLLLFYSTLTATTHLRSHMAHSPTTHCRHHHVYLVNFFIRNQPKITTKMLHVKEKGRCQGYDGGIVRVISISMCPLKSMRYTNNSGEKSYLRQSA